MAQAVVALVEGRILRRELPDPSTDVVEGIRWGRAEALFTPAYWATQAWMLEEQYSPSESSLCTGRSLVEEVVSCVLGGYSVSSEQAMAAFLRLRERDLISVDKIRSDEIEDALRAPLMVGNRLVRYRFWRAKARTIAELLSCLRGYAPATGSEVEFRDSLLGLPGVGLKTASWITRNWLNSDAVAILDVHVRRACQIIGLIQGTERLPRDYRPIEATFLRFARCLGVRASTLDLAMWSQMRVARAVVAETLAKAEAAQAWRHSN
jgi:N-glycosylase/DNA lyase